MKDFRTAAPRADADTTGSSGEAKISRIEKNSKWREMQREKEREAGNDLRGAPGS